MYSSAILYTPYFGPFDTSQASSLAAPFGKFIFLITHLLSPRLALPGSSPCKRGIRLIPSNLISCDGLILQASSNVGIKSICAAIVSIFLPPLNFSGQRMINGTRIPPSHTQHFLPLSPIRQRSSSKSPDIFSLTVSKLEPPIALPATIRITKNNINFRTFFLSIDF